MDGSWPSAPPAISSSPETPEKGSRSHPIRSQSASSQSPAHLPGCPPDNKCSRSPPTPGCPAHWSSSAATSRYLPCRSQSPPSHKAPATGYFPCPYKNNVGPDEESTAESRPQGSRG